MIKAVIFDLNGVIVKSSALSARFQEKFGVSEDKFYPALKEIMAKIRKPYAGDSFVYFEPYFKNWGVNLTKEEFFDFWFSAEKEVPEMIELVKEIKQKGIKLFVLSNNFMERASYYEENFYSFKIFDKIYYSWQTGFVKPDLKAYKHLLSENNLKLDECVYFDDSRENIEAAKSLGIKAFLFENIDSIREIIL
ncbi:MAG: HAD-IA family hydrolase [Candidatus Staskawiczbacteria bacterium]|nr:HAD-IA family hydrolase [Candidatus Staskawiczbacteria bacterium]